MCLSEARGVRCSRDGVGLFAVASAFSILCFTSFVCMHTIKTTIIRTITKKTANAVPAIVTTVTKKLETRGLGLMALTAKPWRSWLVVVATIDDVIASVVDSAIGADEDDTSAFLLPKFSASTGSSKHGQIRTRSPNLRSHRASAADCVVVLV